MQVVATSFEKSSMPLLNRAMFYGDGLFETMRLSGHKIALWKWHYQRLLQGCQRLGLELSKLNRLENAMTEQLKEEGGKLLKLLVFREHQGHGYFPATKQAAWVLLASAADFKAQKPKSELLMPAKNRLAEQPLLAGMKHLNRLEQVLVAAELKHAQADDLLLLSQSGIMVESLFRNLLFIKQGRLFTPTTDLCGVAGVAIDWLRSHQKVKPVSWRLNDLEAVDELLLCNSVRGFSRVEEVIGVKKFTTRTALQDRIQGLWEQLWAN